MRRRNTTSRAFKFPSQVNKLLCTTRRSVFVPHIHFISCRLNNTACTTRPTVIDVPDLLHRHFNKALSRLHPLFFPPIRNPLYFPPRLPQTSSMTSRALPFFVQANATAAAEAAASAQASGTGPVDQDVGLFIAVGKLLFGSDDYTIGSAGEDLDKLHLSPLRRSHWSRFFSNLEQAKADGSLATSSDCWVDAVASQSNGRRLRRLGRFAAG